MTVQTQLKNNKPNAVRRAKRFFATDFIKVSGESAEEKPLLTIAQALKLSRAEDKNELAQAPELKS